MPPLHTAYVTAEEVTALRAAAATAIQRCVRGWLVRRAMAPLVQARCERAADAAAAAVAAAAAAEAARQREAQRRMQPRSASDFAALYDELAMWWGQEQAKIAAAQDATGPRGRVGWVCRLMVARPAPSCLFPRPALTSSTHATRCSTAAPALQDFMSCFRLPFPTTCCAEEERQAARRLLLAKETKLLQTIDRLKLAAAPVVHSQRAAAQLAAAAAPRHWVLTDGRVAQVTTPATQRASELAAAYQALRAADGSGLDARLAALLTAKYHAKAVDCR